MLDELAEENDNYSSRKIKLNVKFGRRTKGGTVCQTILQVRLTKGNTSRNIFNYRSQST